MTISPAPIPRLVIGIVVLVLAVVFAATGSMDFKEAALFALCGVGLML